MEVIRQGAVFVVDLGDDENRIDPDFVGRMEAILDEVEQAAPPRALITTGSGRFYSNGLDLDVVASLDDDEMGELTGRLERLLRRLVSAPFVTVAAIQGHCFAAGALLALAHDYRIMRQDRGWFCLPSVDVGIPFTLPMLQLIAAKVPPPTAQHLVVSGDRMGGAACEGFGVVNDAVDGDQVMPKAVELAARLADKDPATLGTIKNRMYASIGGEG